MDKFCLKWNDYEKNLGTAFNDLREQEELFNVSLISEDGSQVEAHKVVLSACSPFFRNIITRNARHPHPLLFLKGVRHRDLVSLLDFMYRGQVNIAQEDLSTFLSVAEELKVKGLTQGQKAQTTSPSSVNTEKNKNKEQSPQVKLAPPRPPPLSPPPYRPPVSMPQLMPSSSNTKPASFPPDDDIKCLGEGSNLSAATKPMEENTEDDDTLINVVDPDPTDEHSIYPAAPRNEEGGSLRRGIGRKSSSSRQFSPRVSEVMSLSDTKLQCLLCYKKFSTKEESTAHMMTRHRITLDIDKSMRSVYA